MKRWLQKCRSRRGETLTETLVAVLVVALSSTLLATMLAASNNQNQLAMERDAALYQEITAAQQRSGAASDGTITVSLDETGQSVDYAVEFFGQEDQLVSYAVKGGGAP